MIIPASHEKIYGLRRQGTKVTQVQRTTKYHFQEN